MSVDEREPYDYEDALGDFGDQVDRLDAGDCMAMRAAWEGDDPSRRQRAWKEVDAAIATTGRSQAMERLETGLSRWDAMAFIGPTMFAYAGGLPAAVSLMAAGPDGGLARQSAVPPLLDAGAALLVRDAISDDAFEALVGPWRSISEDGDEADGEPSRNTSPYGPAELPHEHRAHRPRRSRLAR